MSLPGARQASERLRRNLANEVSRTILISLKSRLDDRGDTASYLGSRR